MQFKSGDSDYKAEVLSILRYLREKWNEKHIYTSVDLCTWEVGGESRGPLSPIYSMGQ